MSPTARFVIFIGVSIVVFLWLIRFTLRRRASKPDNWRLALVTGIVVVGGMVFAKYGNNIGLPWWIYYTVPALLTLLLPPIAFRMKGRETALYLMLAFLSWPVIHVAFSLVLGWKEYLPFIPVPSIRELMQ
jgi:membrane protease YdiL (CAAX protease family)